MRLTKAFGIAHQKFTAFNSSLAAFVPAATSTHESSRLSVNNGKTSVNKNATLENIDDERQHEIPKRAGGRSRSNQTKRILEEAQALAERGLTKSQAARELGVAPEAFINVLRRHPVSTEWRSGRGHTSETSRNRVSTVVALAAKGLSQSDIAVRLGVTRQCVSQIVKKHGIEYDRKRVVRNTKSIRKIIEARRIERIKRIERMKSECVGMTATQAARHLGVHVSRVYADMNESGFDGLVRFANRMGGRLSEQSKRIVEAAPALAERGLSKSDAARELGIPVPSFHVAIHRHLSDIKWRDGRMVGSEKDRKRQASDEQGIGGPSTVMDDERATMRRVMAETLAETELQPSRDDAGIER